MSLQVGQPVKIRTDRQHIAHLSGSIGEFLGLISVKRDIAVVCCGRWTLNFYLDEIEAIAPLAAEEVQA